MQFYRDGYRPGSPDIHPASPEAMVRSEGLPEHVGVLIVGTGPAGTVLGAQLAAFPGIDTRIIERRDGPLQLGHADGVACRTVEMFQAFGLAEELLREAYWVNEVRFWGPSRADRDRIERTGWVRDTPEGMSEFPHVIVNQARMQEFLLDYMARSSARLTPDYGVELVDVSVGEGEYPVAATVRYTSGDRAGAEAVIHARYVVGCDGAHSRVRRAIGLELHGDDDNHAWGVMDILGTTDFPDWRTKNVVQSDGKGSLLMIPREGGNMVRCYVDLGGVDGAGAVRDTTVEQLIEITNGILHPYSVDVKQVAWSSVYEVGQRLTDSFDDVPAGADATRNPRVFIAGDACHTHSAKAGLGMNVSMQDAFNLGWKLAAVLQGRAEPALLRTYSAERQAVAQELIDFDRFWARFIAEPIADPAHPERGGITSEQMEEQFARQGVYTAGLATKYAASALTGDDVHQQSAAGFEVGTRFHSAPVIRAADGRRLELGHTHTADGRWRLYAFGDRGSGGLPNDDPHNGGLSNGGLPNAGLPNGNLHSLLTWLSDDAESPVQRFRRTDEDVDAVIDVHGILRGDLHDVTLTELPALLLPHTGPLGLQDWEKAWVADPADDIFTRRGIADEGAVVIVRPDQYIAAVLPLSARAEITAAFAGALRDMRAGRHNPHPARKSAEPAGAARV